MRIMCIDIESFSSVDLGKSGVYAYSKAPDFDILLFGYSLDGGQVQVITDLRSKKSEIIALLLDPKIKKTAWNAAFERVCLSSYFNQPLPPEQWECSMVWAMSLGYPAALAQAAEVMGVSQQKLSTGKVLISYFSKPCKPTSRNGNRTRNLPQHDLGKWQLFIEYNAQDVRTEMAIREKLKGRPTPEQDLWSLDQKINDVGMLISEAVVRHAIACNDQYASRLEQEASKLTGLDNPKSVSQLKGWIQKTEDIAVASLDKKAVPELMQQDISDITQRVLELRQELSKSSIAKYETMLNAMCPDGRVRGLLQFYGASRTGRWSGRLVQIQNLPQNHMPQLDEARNLLQLGMYDALEMIFDSIPDVLSQLIRTAFIPSAGCEFIVADFSAIEARVIAWLAGEKWRQDVFATHGKIYEASASAMFNVPIEDVTKGSPLRQKGKVAELALGYQGGPGALKSMGALNMGIEESELPKLVKMWRKSNPHIVQFWSDVEEAALEAVESKTLVKIQYGIQFFIQDQTLYLRLPSGRCLAYVKPRITTNQFGSKSIQFEGLNQTSRKWELTDTYGGKLVENIVQATARDCLAVAMLRLDASGFQIVGHVHDEVILDVPKSRDRALDEACTIMGRPISWADGLILKADGYRCPYYQKD